MGANLVQSLQNIEISVQLQGRRLLLIVNFAGSHHGNIEWLSQLLRTRDFWGIAALRNPCVRGS